MSDTSQGEGWWQASDGKWYAPEQHPDFGKPTEAIDEAGPPTEATPPPTEATPPAGGPPTQAMPPPVGPPPVGPPPGAPGGPLGPPGVPPDGKPNKAKWIIPAVIAAVIIAIVAFLLLRDGDDDEVATSTDSTDQSTDNTDNTDASSDSQSTDSESSSSSSSFADEFVDPNGVENRLLQANDLGNDFTDDTFEPSTDTTDLCGRPNARATVPPVKDVGSSATEAARNLFFQEEVLFYNDAASVKKAFDIGRDSLTTCNEGNFTNSDGSTTPFRISQPTDVSDELGVSTAIEFTTETEEATIITVAARLDNAIALFTFVFPTADAATSAPNEIGVAQDGLDLLLT
jgi:hypothetical protein